jgi:hypothetical protein
VQRGWKTAFLNADDALVFAGVSADSKYIRQVKRWSRDTARSYLLDVQYALRSGKSRAYRYALLNIAANYASDVAIIAEVLFLLTISITSVVHRNKGNEIVPLVLEHFLTASALTVFEHMPWLMKFGHFVHLPGAVAYMYLHAAIVLYSILTIHKVILITKTRSVC